MANVVCCNIITVFDGKELSTIFRDINTGYSVCLCSKRLSHSENMDIIMSKLKSHKGITAYPSTFVFIGDCDIVDNIIVVNMDEFFISGFMSRKSYSCYMEKSEVTPLGAKFFDRLTDREVRLVDCDIVSIVDIKGFTDSVFSSGYEGFSKSGDDSIIISGTITDYGNTIMIASDKNLLMGTSESVYDILARSMR